MMPTLAAKAAIIEVFPDPDVPYTVNGILLLSLTYACSVWNKWERITSLKKKDILMSLRHKFYLEATAPAAEKKHVFQANLKSCLASVKCLTS